MALSETNSWSDSGIFDFERLLDLGVNGTENSKPAKQLACARCYGQKLRCVRRTGDARVCDRCLRANIECVSRQPQRPGRPASTSARHSARTGGPHTGRGGSAAKMRSSVAKRRQRIAQDTQARLSLSAMAVDYGSAATTKVELDRWTWPSPPVDLAQDKSDSSSSSPVQPSTGLMSSASSPSNLETPHALLTSFEELSSSFPSDIDVASLEPQPTPEPDDRAGGYPQPDDPVEYLSRLHLELYHCLISVKSVEELKKDGSRCMFKPSDQDIDASWSETLFRTAERFIEALRGYASPCKASTGSTNPATASMATGEVLDSTEDMDADNRGSQVDMATGFMIVSCYTRLVQIFDVVAFIVGTFKDMDCPGSSVQVRFGTFTPATSKTFQARVLGQYVLHLLEGVSEAVTKAVPSRQPCARAVAEVRRNETKLRERIMTTLH